MNNNLNKPVSLRAVVADVLSSYQRVHRERLFTTINSCPGDLFIYQGKNWLVHLLGDLYKLLEPVPANKAVSISARVVKGNIQLYIADPETKKEGLLVGLWPRLSNAVGIF